MYLLNCRTLAGGSSGCPARAPCQPTSTTMAGRWMAPPSHACRQLWPSAGSPGGCLSSMGSRNGCGLGLQKARMQAVVAFSWLTWWVPWIELHLQLRAAALAALLAPTASSSSWLAELAGGGPFVIGQQWPCAADASFGGFTPLATAPRFHIPPQQTGSSTGPTSISITKTRAAAGAPSRCPRVSAAGPLAEANFSCCIAARAGLPLGLQAMRCNTV